MAKTQTGGGRRIDWFAAGIGLILAVALELGGSSLLLSGHRANPVGTGLLTFGAILGGGALAGSLGPAGSSVWNGIVAAIGFIVAAQLADAAGPGVSLGTGGMDTLGLVINDVLILSGGTLGGILAGGARRLLAR